MTNNDLIALGLVLLATLGFSRGCQNLMLQEQRMSAQRECVQKQPDNLMECAKLYGELESK